MQGSIETTALDPMLDPVARCFTPAVARRIAELEADPELQSRIEELAAKANEGELTDAERFEYEAYVDAGDFIALLQAKARALLEEDPK